MISENINVCVRKLKLPLDVVEKHASNLIQRCEIALIHPSTIESALLITSRYQYSFYDSQIVAAAMENECSILYSEDLQNGQVINGSMRIVNPFIPGSIQSWK